MFPTWPESSVPVTPKYVPWPTKDSPSFLETKSRGRDTPQLNYITKICGVNMQSLGFEDVFKRHVMASPVDRMVR